MASFELAGKLIVKEETNIVSDRFKKREFVLLCEENKGGMVFTDYVKFQLVQDKCDLINEHQLEDELKVSFNLKGNKWEKNGNTSYFTNLDAWRVEKVAGGSTDTVPEAPSFPGQEAEPFSSSDDKAEDLPF